MSPSRSRRPGRGAGPGLPVRLLRLGVFAGLALALATPLVVTPGTVFPFVVGKAVYSRAVVEAVFALWALLALARPEYRPPRSRLLAAFAAGPATALLAAAAGVSFERSFWSDYRRMQGVVDDLHWLALFVVLVSMLRGARSWRRFLAANLAVSSTVAVLAFASYFRWEVPLYGLQQESLHPRVGGPLGNPGFLSGYLLAAAFIACGLGARALALRRGAGPPGRKRPPPPAWSPAGWGAVAALHFGGFALGGSVGAWVGLAAGAGFLGLAALRLARGRRRLLAAGALALLAAAGGAGMWRLAGSGTPPALLPDVPVMRYVAGVHVDRPSSQARLGAWRAGLRGFAERPLLGWGPGNFHAPFNRFASGYAAAAPSFDNAHNEAVETAATAGIAGLAAWAALWCVAFAIVWRAYPRLPPGPRALLLFAGAALAARLAQGQFWFDSPAVSLQLAVHLGFVAALEPSAFAAPATPRLPAFAAGLFRRRLVAVPAATAAVALAASGMAAQRTILAAASVQHVAARPSGSTGINEAIDGFPPLANVPRLMLFEDFADRWPRLRAAPGGGRALLAWVDSEAEAAVAAEPANWEIRSSLARMYREIAATEESHRGRAEFHLARARELAPNRTVFPVALSAPAPLPPGRAEGGRRELRWRPAGGAAYHEVARRSPRGGWRTLGWLYEPGAAAFALPEERPGPGGRAPVYAVRACSAERCGKWIAWPVR